MDKRFVSPALKMRFLTVFAVFFTFSSCIFSTVSSQSGECSTQKDRLLYHYSIHENWSNDPNGLVYVNGTYHLFYQYHPYSIQWGPMHWGHAISKDLMFWEEIDIALYPDEHGTIFSGSAIVDWTNSSGFQTNDGTPPVVAIFTSASDSQRQSIAFSNDQGMNFTKYSGNPVLAQPGKPDFRDPKVFKDRFTGNWTMVLAVALKIEFYGSKDLKEWVKLSEFPWDLPGGIFECPDLVELPTESGDTVWVLMASVSGSGPNGVTGSKYFVGNWNGTDFSAFPWEPTQWWDWGPDNYAGVTWSNDPKNRTIATGWMTSGTYQWALPTETWHGQMTLPREFSIYTLNATTHKYRVKSQPPEEVRNLWNQGQHEGLEEGTGYIIPPQENVILTPKSFNNSLLELNIALEVTNGADFQICAFNSLDEEVCFGLKGTTYFLDRTKSGKISFHEVFEGASYSIATREITDDIVQLRIFLDTGSIEVFADDGLTVMTGLFFPTEIFDGLYMRHTSSLSSGATLRVKQYQLYGLSCTVKN